MGIAILVVSIIAFFTLSSGPMMKGFNRMMEGHVKQEVEPPARRSVIVDLDGVAHRTADGTQMTKRDRSRFIEPVQPPPIQPEPAVAPPTTHDSATPPEIKLIPVPDDSYQYQEEQVVSQDPVGGDSTELSMGRKIAETLAKDPILSDSARLTLRASYRDGLVTLQGVVSDEKEKLYLATKAQGISGVTSVENQLHTLNEYTAPSS